MTHHVQKLLGLSGPRPRRIFLKSIGEQGPTHMTTPRDIFRDFFYVTSAHDLVTLHLHRLFSCDSPMLPDTALLLHPM